MVASNLGVMNAMHSVIRALAILNGNILIMIYLYSFVCIWVSWRQKQRTMNNCLVFVLHLIEEKIIIQTKNLIFRRFGFSSAFSIIGNEIHSSMIYLFVIAFFFLFFSLSIVSNLVRVSVCVCVLCVYECCYTCFFFPFQQTRIAHQFSY